MHYGECAFWRSVCVSICLQRWLLESTKHCASPALLHRLFWTYPRVRDCFFCSQWSIFVLSKKQKIKKPYFFFRRGKRAEAVNWNQAAVFQLLKITEHPKNQTHDFLSSVPDSLTWASAARTQIFAERSLQNEYNHHAKTKWGKLNR